MAKASKEPKVFVTDDDRYFERQKNGSYTDGDMTFESLQAIKDAGIKEEKITDPNIDMDVECRRCEQKGAAPNGLCLTCFNEDPEWEESEEGKPEEEESEEEDPGPVYSMELVQINFTKDEKIELGVEAADKVERLKSIERQKKSAAADFAAREKQVSLELDELARKISDGFEMRRENCIVLFDDPTHTVHFIMEHDTSGAIIKQRKMTSSEMQRALPGV